LSKVKGQGSITARYAFSAVIPKIASAGCSPFSLQCRFSTLPRSSGTVHSNTWYCSRTTSFTYSNARCAAAAIGSILSGGLWFGCTRAQQPADAVVHYDRGVHLQDQGKLDEAVAEFRKAIRLKPDLAEAHGNLGVALRAQGKQEEAIAEFRAATRIKPDSADAHISLGVALKAQGKLEEAVAESRTAIRIKPDDADKHVNLGNLLDDQGKLAEAIAEYRAALRLKPDYSGAHYNLGLALRKQRSLGGVDRRQ